MFVVVLQWNFIKKRKHVQILLQIMIMTGIVLLSFLYAHYPDSVEKSGFWTTPFILPSQESGKHKRIPSIIV